MEAGSGSGSELRYELRYEQPAQYFEETLLLGNGRVGASLFGGIGTERIYLNDATLWSGGPVDARMNRTAHEHLPAVRGALLNKDYEAADSLVRQLQGKFSESYAPLGTLLLEMNHGDEAYNGFLAERKLTELRLGAEFGISHPGLQKVIRMGRIAA